VCVCERGRMCRGRFSRLIGASAHPRRRPPAAPCRADCPPPPPSLRHSGRSFVTEPHEQDASFRRIGDMLKAAKAQRGLCR
jgi:hypothetical protein